MTVLVRGADSDADLAIGPLQLTLRRRTDGESVDESATDAADATTRLELRHLPRVLVVDVLVNILRVMFVQFQDLSTVFQALPFFLHPQSPMYTHILLLVHRATRRVVPKERPSRSSTLMARLRNTLHRNSSMTQTAVVHRAVVHLKHPPLLR